MRWNYYKLRQLSLLQSAMGSFYKLGQLFSYKVRHGLLPLRQVLQSAMIITNCDSTICSWNIQSVSRKKSRLAWSGVARNRWVIVTLLVLSTLTSKRWLGWRKTESPRKDRLGWFCDTYYKVTFIVSFILDFSLIVGTVSRCCLSGRFVLHFLITRKQTYFSKLII